jgi:hypothetical protein
VAFERLILYSALFVKNRKIMVAGLLLVQYDWPQNRPAAATASKDDQPDVHDAGCFRPILL